MWARKHVKSVLALVFALVPLVAGTSEAGGPLALCKSGQPYVWPDGGRNIPFHTDLGRLGIFSNAEAVALVEQSFGAWEAVPTSTVSFVNGGALPVDVDITNFAEYMSSGPDGWNPIVFDDTGEIFDLLYGSDSGVWGFAGPIWVDPSTCTILEGHAFLKGVYPDATVAQDAMVHEFGHFANLAHSEVNAQLFLGISAVSSPDPNLFPPPDPFADIIETMTPSYFGPATGMRTPHADEIAALSTLYPEAGFLTTEGSICGTVYAPNGKTRLSGINVIARNVLDPYHDAVSVLSGYLTYGTEQNDPLVGRYCLHGLTPGASYVVFVGPIHVPGTYSTTPVLLPGPEEFYNGPEESANPKTDDPLDYELVTPVPGSPVTGIDIVLNHRVPDEPLQVGDEGAVELYLPFSVELCGETYDSVFVHGNGFLSFGHWKPLFSYFVNTPEFLGGSPRIAPFWADFNVAAGGLVTFRKDGTSVKILWENVPEYPDVGSNSFAISLFRSHGGSSAFLATYGSMTAQNGIAGFSCGSEDTSSFETETDLTSSFAHHGTHFVDSLGKTAVFEEFTNADNDLAGRRLYFKGTSNFFDRFEPNDSIRRATKVKLPFSTLSDKRFTEIHPAGNDVDYFEFEARAGDVVTAEIVIASVVTIGFTNQLDTVMGLFQIVGHGHGHDEQGVLLAVDDDSGSARLSKIVLTIPEDGRYAVAVSTYPDFDFSGDGSPGSFFDAAQGRYVLKLSK